VTYFSTVTVHHDDTFKFCSTAVRVLSWLVSLCWSRFCHIDKYDAEYAATNLSFAENYWPTLF